MSERQIIQPVMLVPIIAPMTTPIAWRTFIMPELTKPTTITDVAEEDWITAVTPVPSRMSATPPKSSSTFEIPKIAYLL